MQIKIPAVLILFPLTLFMTYFVSNEHIESKREFEQHRGAYTDLGQLYLAIKNADSVPHQVVPATIPRRITTTPEIRIADHKIETFQQALSDTIVTKQSSASKNEQLLTQIVEEHHRPDTIQATAPSMAMTTAGLMSPKSEAEKIAEKLLEKKSSSLKGDRFDPTHTNAARLDVMIMSASIEKGASEIDVVEYVSLADESDIVLADKGRMTFEYLISSPIQYLAGRMSAKGHVTTRVHLPLERGSFGTIIPLLSEMSLRQYIKDQDINPNGGFLMIDLDQSIIDAELDQKYAHKGYLDANFKPNEGDDSARFLLFSGVQVGNSTIRYLTSQRKMLEKVVHIALDEIVYEMPIVKDENEHYFGLYEVESLSLLPRELSVSERKIKPLGQNHHATQETLNYYTLDYGASLLGQRHYTEIEHLGSKFYIGHHGAKSLILPAQGFVNEVYAFHSIERLDGSCMLQVNFDREKEIYKLEALGHGAIGIMDFDQSYLNKDGTVSLEATEFTTHAFFLGHEFGEFSLKVEYIDGTFDFINSFCVPNHYLLEQL